MNTETPSPSPELAELNATFNAVREGNEEAADRHWREFVRILWYPMRATVPWVMPPKAHEVQA
jgi:hypothetical protein